MGQTGSFGSEKNINIMPAESVLQVCMDVLVSQHFIGNPVEDVEYEKAQGKDSSRYCVDPFSSVNETLVKNFSVI